MSQCCAAVTQTVVTWASRSDIWSQFSPDYYNRKSLFAALTKKKVRAGLKPQSDESGGGTQVKWLCFPLFAHFHQPVVWWSQTPLKFGNILFPNRVIQELIWSNFAVTAVVTSYFSRFYKMLVYVKQHTRTQHVDLLCQQQKTPSTLRANAAT